MTRFHWNTDPLKSTAVSTVNALRLVFGNRPFIDSELLQQLRLLVEGVTTIDRECWHQALLAAVGDAESPLPKGILASATELVAAAHPRLSQEIVSRCGPIKMQWQARGPGLARSLQRLTGQAWPDSIELWPSQPWSGGDVYPIHESDTLIFEAVLTDIQPMIPEVVRFAWGLARLSSPESGSELIWWFQR